MATTAAQRAWRDKAQITLMRCEAADGGRPLRIPLVMQTRLRKDGVRVYRWKEKCDYGAGDASEEFERRDECVRDGERYAAVG